MKEILGKTEYEITKLSKERYRVTIGDNTKSFNIDATEGDLTRLIDYISLIRNVTPIDVIEARKKGVCRICLKPISIEVATYDFGKEYAHHDCLYRENDD